MHHLQLNMSNSNSLCIFNLCQQTYNLSQFILQLKNLLVTERVLMRLKLLSCIIDDKEDVIEIENTRGWCK